MLGCHDFCAYYEWTFAHVRATWGQDAVRNLWSQAIGGESQQAYTDAARRAGLRGLLEVWTQTGRDENCDWTFTLDESANTLRWDMRHCPSKGFLLDHDLNADEDYCDHCIGWMAPLLAGVGVEVAQHEHNHRGQCWGEMRVSARASTSLDIPVDMRRSPDWNSGYVDVFINGQRVNDDPCHTFVTRFAGCDSIAVGQQVITDEQWLDSPNPTQVLAIVVGADAGRLRKVASQWCRLSDDRRPLLLHAYFPRTSAIDFFALGLPRPLPILPILIRASLYTHVPGAEHPSLEQQADWLIQAVDRVRQCADRVCPTSHDAAS
jgi:hypothetical protein